jgi:hypothetical protein
LSQGYGFDTRQEALREALKNFRYLRAFKGFQRDSCRAIFRAVPAAIPAPEI